MTEVESPEVASGKEAVALEAAMTVVAISAAGMKSP